MTGEEERNEEGRKEGVRGRGREMEEGRVRGEKGGGGGGR